MDPDAHQPVLDACRTGDSISRRKGGTIEVDVLQRSCSPQSALDGRHRRQVGVHSGVKVEPVVAIAGAAMTAAESAAAAVSAILERISTSLLGSEEARNVWLTRVCPAS